MATWSEHYNIHTISLGRGVLTITVAWNSTAPKGSETGYTVRVGDRKLKALFKDLNEAKRAGIALAKKIAAEITTEVNSL